MDKNGQFFIGLALAILCLDGIRAVSVKYKHSSELKERQRADIGRERQTREDEYVSQDDFNEAINALTSMINALQTDLSSVNSSVNGNEGRLTEIEAQQAEERVDPQAFFGRLEEPVYYDGGQIYQFDDIVTNSGDSYSNGKVTCQVTGWYLASVSLFADRLNKEYSHDLFGNLMKGDTVVATVSATEYVFVDDTQWANLQVSNTNVVWCAEGEELYVKGSDWGGQYAKTSSGYFSVALLHKEY